MRITISLIFSAIVALTSASQAEQSRVAIVGIIAPLSGSLSEYGVAIQRGVQLATLDAGKKAATIKWIWEDSRSDTRVAVSAFERLANTAGIELVFLWGTTPSEAVAPIAQMRKVPLLAMTISPTVARNRSLVLRTVGDAAELVRPLTDHLNGNFDIVGVFLGFGQIRTFFRQAAALQLQAKFFGSDFFGSEKEILESGSAINNSVFPHLAVCPSFVAHYKKGFADDSHVAYALNAYDMANLLIDKQAVAAPGEPLFNALQRMST